MYCRRACQKRDWSRHKPACKRAQEELATRVQDYLARPGVGGDMLILEEIVPFDEAFLWQVVKPLVHVDEVMWPGFGFL